MPDKRETTSAVINNIQSLSRSELQRLVQELEAARARLADENHRFRQFYQRTPVGYVTTDDAGIILEANPRFAEMIHADINDVVGAPLARFVSEESQTIYQVHRDMLLAQRAAQCMEIRFLRSKQPGSTFVAQLESTLMQSTASQGPQYLNVVTDNTECAEVEERLLQSEERFRVALRGSPVVVYSQDTDLRYTWVYNTQNNLAKILGKRDQDILEDQEEAAHLTSLKQKVLETGQTLRTQLRLHADGQARFFDLTIDPRFDGNHDVIGIVGANLDITDYKDIEFAERQHRRLAEALSTSALALNSTLDQSQVLDEILGGVGRVVPHTMANIMLVNGRTVFVSRSYQPGDGSYQDTGVRLTRFDIDQVPTLQQMMTTHEVVILNDLRSVQNAWNAVLEVEHIQSYTGAPLVVQDMVLGFINLYSEAPQRYRSTHQHHLKGFAAQAALAIHNAQLHQRAKELAAIEERQRLARDLHDAVSQSLFASRILPESLPAIWQQKPERIPEHLDKLILLNQSALAEMRILLLELRPEQLLKMSLREALHKLTEAVRGRRQMELSVHCDDSSDIPTDIAVTVYRIAQEALNNVAKHSFATQCEVILRADHQRLMLSVGDNGNGFDPDNTGAGIGLSSMRERAAAIDATIDIQSQIGQGTRISLIWYW
ncbi:MAG: PAS domain S-box protein [Chloroflexi bacterium]|nr:PAS domain S-box protein [Chloroflexota bacterium]